MSKKIRQQALLEIVSEKVIPSQALLAEELRARGHQVTQTTLCRDIAELNMVKSKEGYRLPEDVSGATGGPGGDPQKVLRTQVLKVETSLSTVVIRTPQGSAKQVGVALDRGPFEQLLGNVAGDDTVIAVARSSQDALEFKRILLELIG